MEKLDSMRANGMNQCFLFSCHLQFPCEWPQLAIVLAEEMAILLKSQSGKAQTTHPERVCSFNNNVAVETNPCNGLTSAFILYPSLEVRQMKRDLEFASN